VSEPTTLSIALRVRRWADEQKLTLLPEARVPGADAVELARLAALGGVVGAIAGGRTDRWPPELSAWCNAAPVPPSSLIDDIMLALDRDQDVLAAIYERTVTPRHRRQLGTFFTSPPLVEHMLDRAEHMLDRPPGVIVDPGAGVGAFTAAAARRWPKARVLAVDVNLVTLGLLGARLTYDGLEPQVNLILEDFLAWIAGPMTRDPEPWLYLGNPPYTRTQALDAETKARAATLTDGDVRSGHATLSTIFAAAIQSRLRSQDAMCLLLPAAWTHTQSARELREALWKKVWRPLELHRWPSRTRAFVGPGVTATVLSLGPARQRRQPYRFARAEIRGGSVDMSALETRSRQTPCPDPWPGGAGRRGARAAEATVPLSEFCRVRRGVATGANRFFFVSHEIATTLPTGIQRAGLMTLRGAQLERGELDLAAWVRLRERGAACILLDIAEADMADPAVATYIDSGEALGLHERYLCAHRDPWYSLEAMLPPDLIIGPLVARTMHVVRNTVAALPSNSLYGLYAKPDVHEPEIAALQAWLRGADGMAAVQAHGHRLPGGSCKLEPGSLRTLPVPLSILEQQDELSPPRSRGRPLGDESRQAGIKLIQGE
jgi:adenine-specific DNA-methyltransferase